jgi:radical SAM protein with 4Fe4S-binding SPASM domain
MLERLRKLRRRVYRDPVSAARALAARWRGLPSRLTLDTVAACNISCVMCTIHEWGPGQIMSLDTFRSLKHVYPKVAGVSFSCSGEPFLNKKLFQMIGELREVAPRSHTELFTNGTLVTEEKVNQLIDLRFNRMSFSIDGATKETFERVRVEANFEQVVEAMETVKAVKKARGSALPVVSVNFVAMRENVHELAGVVRLASRVGAVSVSAEGLEPYMPHRVEQTVYGTAALDHLAAFQEAEAASRELGLPLFLPSLTPLAKRHCEYWSPLIAADGSVSPCFATVYSRPIYISGERHLREKISFGNVNEKDFWEIWDSQDYRTFRQNMGTSDLNEVCKSCMVCQGVIVGEYPLPSPTELAGRIAAREAGLPSRISSETNRDSVS